MSRMKTIKTIDFKKHNIQIYVLRNKKYNKYYICMTIDYLTMNTFEHEDKSIIADIIKEIKEYKKDIVDNISKAELVNKLRSICDKFNLKDLYARKEL